MRFREVGRSIEHIETRFGTFELKSDDLEGQMKIMKMLIAEKIINAIEANYSELSKSMTDEEITKCVNSAIENEMESACREIEERIKK